MRGRRGKWGLTKQRARELAVQIHRKVAQGRYSISSHALQEGFKDGIMPTDIKRVLLTGEVIEDYDPDRPECLILGYTQAENIPVHLAVNYTKQIRVKTCYVPQPAEWGTGRIRKPKRHKGDVR